MYCFITRNARRFYSRNAMIKQPSRATPTFTSAATQVLWCCRISEIWVSLQSFLSLPGSVVSPALSSLLQRSWQMEVVGACATVIPQFNGIFFFFHFFSQAPVCLKRCCHARCPQFVQHSAKKKKQQKKNPKSGQSIYCILRFPGTTTEPWHRECAPVLHSYQPWQETKWQKWF